MICNKKRKSLTGKMALYQGFSVSPIRNDEETIHELTCVSKFIRDGSGNECKAKNDLQRSIDVSKKFEAYRMSTKRNKQLFKTSKIFKLSPLSKLISKRYRHSKMKYEQIILFQGIVKKNNVNIFVFFPSKSKRQVVSKQIIKIQRYLASITSISLNEISKIFKPHYFNIPRKKIQDQLRKNTCYASNPTYKNNESLKKQNKKAISPRTPTSLVMNLLKEYKSSNNLFNHLNLFENSLTEMRPNVNFFEMENASIPFDSEEYYMVNRIYYIYIMSRSKKCPHYPPCSKKMIRGKKDCVPNIFEQSCKIHNELLKKTAMPCCRSHKNNVSTVMDSFVKKKRCIEKDYENMLRQISKLMHTCQRESPKLRVSKSQNTSAKKIRCKKEIMPLCRNCKHDFNIKPKNDCKPKCMSIFGKILKSTYNRCSKQAKTTLKNNDLGKKIKATCGQCSQKAIMKLKAINLDKILRKLYGQCTQQVASKIKTKLTSTKQDCYMLSVHTFPHLKLLREPEIYHFKQNAVFQFMSIINPEQSKIVNCAAIRRTDSIIVNNTLKNNIQQRNCSKNNLLLVKKRTSVVFLDMKNFTEYDVRLQGMFKDPSKSSSNKSPKSISFDIPEDNESSQSSMERDSHDCCFKNCQDTDEYNYKQNDNEISNECKNKLCNAKTSPIKVKLPLPTCIDCSREYKQCDMGLNTLPQNIELECKPLNSKKPRIIRRQKIAPSFSPECIIEIDSNGKEIDYIQEIKRNKTCQPKIKKCRQPFWGKLLQKITKKHKRSKRKVRTNELYKSLSKDDINYNKMLSFSDFQKMNEQQLIDIICELKKATFYDSPSASIQTSSKSESSDSYIKKGTDEPKYNKTKNYHDRYKNKRIIITKVPQNEGPGFLNSTSTKSDRLIPKRKVYTSNYSQCEKDSSKSVKNIYWRCATKDGKKKKKRNKLTKVKKPRILKQQIIKCHLSSHRIMKSSDVAEPPDRIREFDKCGKNLTLVHSIECIQSLTENEKEIEKPYRPFWFKKFSNKTNSTKHQQSQACETEIEEQCESVLDDNISQPDELTFSVFEMRTEKQLKHIIYDSDYDTSSFNSSLRKKISTQTCEVVDKEESYNFVLSEDIELTFSDFQTMNNKQLNDIICQLQHAMLSRGSIDNPHRSSLEINEKQCGNDDVLTLDDFQRSLKDVLSDLQKMSSFDSNTSNSSAKDVETSSKTDSTSSCASDGEQESASSAVYSLSSYRTKIEYNRTGFNFLIRPNTANVHKFFRIFRIK